MKKTSPAYPAIVIILLAGILASQLLFSRVGFVFAQDVPTPTEEAVLPVPTEGNGEEVLPEPTATITEMPTWDATSTAVPEWPTDVPTLDPAT